MRIHPIALLAGSGFAAALVLGGCAPDGSGSETAGERVAERSVATTGGEAAASESVTLKVEGMTCSGCALGARTALRRLDGVEKAEVSFEEQLAVIVYDPARVTVEAMADAVRELGFEASLHDGA